VIFSRKMLPAGIFTLFGNSSFRPKLLSCTGFSFSPSLLEPRCR